MEAFARAKEGWRLRKVDVKSWSSPAAKQHSIRSLPTLHLYEGRKLVSTDSKEIGQRINAAAKQ